MKTRFHFLAVHKARRRCEVMLRRGLTPFGARPDIKTVDLVFALLHADELSLALAHRSKKTRRPLGLLTEWRRAGKFASAIFKKLGNSSS